MLSIPLYIYWLLLPQVSDFGLAKPETYSPEGGRFPIKWTAPEALKDSVCIIIAMSN